MDNSTLYERILRSLPEATDDECWFVPYKGARNGYPQICMVRDDGVETMRTISRLVWEMHNAEPIPDGMVVCHTCDDPRCVNPHHLWIGTVADNNRDRDEKGRTRYRSGRRFNRKYGCIYRVVHTRANGLKARPRYKVKVTGFPARSFLRLADAVRHRDSLKPR